ncbi:hypothetical protein X798_08033 [Onchocerca flexuosa]|uniref:RING-type domain-containing protein n=1 Tax=Onchocerca flexuosa TaxID=387005 RepID=A0A238BHM1_9BILA|nr:hypothetical protein X798_08033 [Onchocerca flexuosa]
MEFWFHCNNCTRRPENWIHIPSYRLTSCGHILCCECFGDTDTVKICKICHRTGIKTHAIDGTLPPYIQKFFLIVQLWYQLRKAKQDLEEKNQLEIEIVCLKKALECLKGELQRTFSNHREFEKHARQWGFRMLSIEGNGENFSRDQRAVQFSEISGESVDLSLKGKIDSMNKKLILSRSSSNSCLAKGATPSFNSSISITSKKDYRIGVQGSGAQRDIVSLNKLRTIRNEFNRRKSYRLQNSDGIMVPGSVYRKCAANVMYPIILLRRVRADTMTATRTANSESIRTIYKSMLY